MKKLTALCLLTLSTASFAADRDIYDLMYLPSVGTNFGISTLSYNTGKTEFSGDTETKNNGYGFQQTLGRAVSNNLSLSLGMNFTRTNSDTAGDKSHERGFSDPTLGARYRIMDGAFRVDLLGNATFSTGEPSNESLRTGGHAVALGAQAGQKNQNFQWAITALVNRSLESEKNDVKYDPTNNYFFGADVLSRLNDRGYVRGYIDTTFADETKFKAGGQSAVSSTTYNAGAQYRHIHTADLMLTGGVNYGTLNRSTVESAGLWTVSVGALYQF
jgi:hypothetical protein